MAHTFHIPVMGLGYTADSPVKVAKFGITSVVSITDDILLEQLRGYYAQQYGFEYTEIKENQLDARALRIEAYLNLLGEIVEIETTKMLNQAFETDSDLDKYFELLPSEDPLALKYLLMKETPDQKRKIQLQKQLRESIKPGGIDTNLMTKLDRTRYDKDGQAMPAIYTDASSAVRGYANSNLKNSSIVLSAGMNLRLFGYMETLNAFCLDESGTADKNIILKVSDYRSAQVQGLNLAKRGLWVSEFRVESGLNCGGHAFATDGYLMGPILDEFSSKKGTLHAEMFRLLNLARTQKGLSEVSSIPEIRISVQGGIGTHNEDLFLRKFYGMDSTGWGSPFLLVPEATTVDDKTMERLAASKEGDVVLSDASPLGVKFNYLKGLSGEHEREARFEKGKPGSPCLKKFLSSNTEFSDQPICTASVAFMNKKIAQINTDSAHTAGQLKEVNAKECLCSGLTNSTLIKYGLKVPKGAAGVTMCPGPNIVFFDKIASLKEMVGHIYGKTDLLGSKPRPNLFVNELRLYIEHFQQLTNQTFANSKAIQHVLTFKKNLEEGIDYYKKLASEYSSITGEVMDTFFKDLVTEEERLNACLIPSVVAS